MNAASVLGQNTAYINQYQADLLYPIARSKSRLADNIDAHSFQGVDVWYAYEFSWLNTDGCPQTAVVRLTFPCETQVIIESKSLKLYFFSFSQSQFTNTEAVQQTIKQDLQAAAQHDGIEVDLLSLHAFQKQFPVHEITGTCIDNSKTSCSHYHPNADLISIKQDTIIEETIYSHALKTNCPVTGQPDWASIVIHYRGPAINHEDCFRYLVSFREHGDFHEACVERIFHDLMQQAGCEALCVHAHYTRRGGLDITPCRYSPGYAPPALQRHSRQ